MQSQIRLVDVGARDGIHARWSEYFRFLDVRAFEPDLEECERLNRQRWPYKVKFLPNALGAHDGEEATLHICRQPGCSSLLKPNLDLCLQFPYGENMQVVAQHRLKLSRLDTACADFPPDVLKIDTQGTELSILQGAGDLLDSTTAVELEVEFVPQYVDQPLFADIDVFMRSKGFMLRGLRRSYWRNGTTHAHSYGGQLMHGDALYLRHDRLDSRKGHIILAAYRQYDLLSLYNAQDMIPPVSLPTRFLRLCTSRFSNRNMRRFMDRLRPVAATDWHDPDYF